MVRNSDLSRETEQFSFIRTLSVDPHQNGDGNNDDLNQQSLINENSRTSKTKTSEASEIVALCKTSSQGNTASLVTNNHTTISDRWYSLDTSNQNTLSTVVVLPESELPDKLDKKRFAYYLDRIFLIFAGGYLCFVFWWLFGTKNAIFPLTFLSKQESISQADAEFIDYMKQSLEVIDRQVAKKQSSASQVTSSEKATSEVVYVPVYTPTSTSTPNNSLNLSQPNTLLPPPPPPNQLAAMNPPVSAIPIKPPAAPSESVEVKTTPVKTSAKSTPQKETKPKIAAATIKPQKNYTLVGVMELKEGSAALFKINGVTQRIWLGEKIENTDWVLDSVANQQAQISHQGKSLTLSVGEKF